MAKFYIFRIGEGRRDVNKDYGSQNNRWLSFMGLKACFINGMIFINLTRLFILACLGTQFFIHILRYPVNIGIWPHVFTPYALFFSDRVNGGSFLSAWTHFQGNPVNCTPLPLVVGYRSFSFRFLSDRRRDAAPRTTIVTRHCSLVTAVFDEGF